MSNVCLDKIDLWKKQVLDTVTEMVGEGGLNKHKISSPN